MQASVLGPASVDVVCGGSHARGNCMIALRLIHVCCHLPLVCVYCFSIVYFYIVKYCHAYFVEGAIQILSVD